MIKCMWFQGVSCIRCLGNVKVVLVHCVGLKHGEV